MHVVVVLQLSLALLCFACSLSCLSLSVPSGCPALSIALFSPANHRLPSSSPLSLPLFRDFVLFCNKSAGSANLRLKSYRNVLAIMSLDPYVAHPAQLEK